MDRTLSKEEQSLLLYLESRAVDGAGTIDSRHINPEDYEKMKLWRQEGFIKMGRISKTKENEKKLPSIWCDHWVEMSELAWQAAQALRKERAERLLTNRLWLKAEE